MRDYCLLVLLLLLSTNSFSQTTTFGNNTNNNSAFNNKDEQQKKAPITLYKIISADRDTTIIDTTLTIQKEYKFNYLRRDRFELLPFSNVGHTYNSLAYDFQQTHLLPLFAAQSHHFNFMEVEDISYYEVATPLTDLYFKTAFEQGQQLDAFFTINTSKQFNFSVAYKGVRSLGNYQNNLASTGNFRLTTNYKTKNERYFLRAHLVAQDILNEENGGLTENSIALFEENVGDFTDRGRLDVNFEDADNLLKGIRYYVDNEYHVIKSADSTSYTRLALGASFMYQEKNYNYSQGTAFADFGDAYNETNLRDKVTLQHLDTKAYARFENNILGTLGAFVGYNDYNYGYNQILLLDAGNITNRLLGNLIQAGASYKKQYKKFELTGRAGLNVSGDFEGNYIQGAAAFTFLKDIKARASLHVHSAAPNFNFLLYQSDYVDYNWQNDFNNVKTQELKFEISSPTYGEASVSYTGIDDYTYFGTTLVAAATDEAAAIYTQPTPFQALERVDYLKLKIQKEFAYKKFRLANTILYQNVASGTDVFKVPTFITRNSLYYQDKWFKNALFLQTGVNFKYFPKYEANAYNPVLGEFVVQDQTEIGAFPLIDIFFNAKVRQTRIFFKYEHVNSLFANRNTYFSAPGYPYRDGIIRFGLVWNFFL